MDIFGVGLPEMMLILVVALLVFGPRKLPEIGRTLAKGMRSLQDASKEFEAALNREAAELERSTGLKTQKNKASIPATKTDNPEKSTLTSQTASSIAALDEADPISEQETSNPSAQGDSAQVATDTAATSEDEERDSISSPPSHIAENHHPASDLPLATPMAAESPADLSESPAPQA
jgi:sec-independent protein translocase protein TatA